MYPLSGLVELETTHGYRIDMAHDQSFIVLAPSSSSEICSFITSQEAHSEEKGQWHHQHGRMSLVLES